MARKILVIDGADLAAVDPAEFRHLRERWIVTNPDKRLYRLERNCALGAEIVTLNGLTLDIENDYTVDQDRLVIAADLFLSPGDKLAIRYWTA